MAAALCKNAKITRKEKHVEIWAAKLTGKNRWNSKELQNVSKYCAHGLSEQTPFSCLCCSLSWAPSFDSKLE